MRELKIYKEFCTGCGLCSSVENIVMKEEGVTGFLYPELSEKNIGFCEQVCPASGKRLELHKGKIWGDYRKVFIAWSKNSDIRKRASSGGVMTSICIYLLEQKKIDGILQVKANENVPYKTTVVISRTKEEVLACSGSRYGASAPLKDILSIVKENERYAFVGKPCDVWALKNYMEKNENLSKKILYTLSFFCAGTPSLRAQKKLLSALDCANIGDCTSLQYRGNGWPGYTIAVKKDGSETQLTYEKAWGEILGRDVRKCCRFCVDGIGMFADIACGDAWYLKENKPDFSEKEGRNVVFARSVIGEECFEDAVRLGYLCADDYDNSISDLRLIQKYQYERKATMRSMLFAFKIFGNGIPYYPKDVLKSYAKMVGIKFRFRRFLGIIKRILLGKF